MHRQKGLVPVGRLADGRPSVWLLHACLAHCSADFRRVVRGIYGAVGEHRRGGPGIGNCPTDACQERTSIAPGDVIAVLDNDVLHATLAAARAKAMARGNLQAAEATVKLRQNRFAKMQSLLDQEHASPEEVERAATDLEIAEAELTQARTITCPSA